LDHLAEGCVLAIEGLERPLRRRCRVSACVRQACEEKEEEVVVVVVAEEEPGGARAEGALGVMLVGEGAERYTSTLEPFRAQRVRLPDSHYDILERPKSY